MVRLPGRWICGALLVGRTVRTPATAFFCTRGESKRPKDLQPAIASPEPALEASGRAGKLKADERPRSNNLQRQRRREERSDEAISK
jgi:hypothetical protein